MQHNNSTNTLSSIGVWGILNTENVCCLSVILCSKVEITLIQLPHKLKSVFTLNNICSIRRPACLLGGSAVPFIVWLLSLFSGSSSLRWDGHLWKSSEDKRRWEWPLPLHEPEGETCWKGTIHIGESARRLLPADTEPLYWFQLLFQLIFLHWCQNLFSQGNVWNCCTIDYIQCVIHS